LTPIGDERPPYLSLVFASAGRLRLASGGAVQIARRLMRGKRSTVVGGFITIDDSRLGSGCCRVFEQCESDHNHDYDNDDHDDNDTSTDNFDDDHVLDHDYNPGRPRAGL
jgi:hypothetical protein